MSTLPSTAVIRFGPDVVREIYFALISSLACLAVTELFTIIRVIRTEDDVWLAITDSSSLYLRCSIWPVSGVHNGLSRESCMIMIKLCVCVCVCVCVCIDKRTFINCILADFKMQFFGYLSTGRSVLIYRARGREFEPRCISVLWGVIRAQIISFDIVSTIRHPRTHLSAKVI